VISRTNYNLKTLQKQPLTVAFEGALTYRTIQFSMSSRCFHPKASGTRQARRPIQGTKNLRAGILSHHSGFSASHGSVCLPDSARTAGLFSPSRSRRTTTH